MQHYALFDSAGLNPAFWNDDVYPPAADGSRNAAIPAAAVALTEAQWAECLANQGARRWLNGALQPYTPPPGPPPARVLLGNAFLGAVADLGWWGWMDQGAADQEAAAPQGAGKPLDARYWRTIGKDDRVLVSDAKLVRVARAAEAARVAASGQPAPAAPIITMSAAFDRADALVGGG